MKRSTIDTYVGVLIPGPDQGWEFHGQDPEVPLEGQHRDVFIDGAVVSALGSNAAPGEHFWAFYQSPDIVVNGLAHNLTSGSDENQKANVDSLAAVELKIASLDRPFLDPSKPAFGIDAVDGRQLQVEVVNVVRLADADRSLELTPERSYRMPDWNVLPTRVLRFNDWLYCENYGEDGWSEWMMFRSIHSSMRILANGISDGQTETVTFRNGKVASDFLDKLNLDG